jgi:serpin B
MVFRSLISAGLISLLVGLGCSQPEPTESADSVSLDRTPGQLTQTERRVTGSSVEFGFSLFRKVSEATAPDKNVFVSPLSVSYALGMTYN